MTDSSTSNSLGGVEEVKMEGQKVFQNGKMNGLDEKGSNTTHTD